VRQYLNALDSILASNPHLQSCAAHCIHCGIRFLTHPRNAGRENLRCPFGCREHHRRKRSSQRSTAYYQTATGKKKKKLLNARRSRSSLPACGEQSRDELGDDREVNSPNVQLPEELSVKVELRLGSVVLNEANLVNSHMMQYVWMVTSLIEGIFLTRNELIAHLRQAMRQHSIANRKRVDYVLRFLHQHPP
jgi:hypothetical protein